MTDDQVIAKVRAAAAALTDMTRRLGNAPNIDIVCRAALAMVEQWEWHRSEGQDLADERASAADEELRFALSVGEAAHRDSADRIMAALRKAVGE